MLRFISTRFRLALGLASICVTMLLIAQSVGLMPNGDAQRLRDRANWAETFALSVAALEASGSDRLLQEFVESQANPDHGIFSVGLRHRDGRLLAASRDHELGWQTAVDSSDRLTIPLQRRNQPWGTVEIMFAPLAQSGWQQIVSHPSTILTFSVGVGCFIGFYFYLGFMLTQLDPSQSVPTRVRSALDNLTEGLLVVDRQGRIVLANAAFAQFIGKPQEELFGKRPADFAWRSGDGEAVEQFPWDESLETNETVVNQLMQLDRPGLEPLIFHVNCSPVGKNQLALGVMISFEDITQLEANKRALHEAKLAAEAASGAKSTFLANMSHEIRTPMNAILGFTELLQRGEVSDAKERQEFLDTIHRSGRHLLELINDILDLSKIEADKLTIEQAPFSPFDVLCDVQSTLSIRARQKGIFLKMLVPCPLPVSICSDAARFRQIVTNLVGNAIKFTEQGGVTMVIDLLDAPSGSRLRLRVADSGIGMTAEQQARLFQPFCQADSSITRRFGGTGLGLAISKRLAEAMQGTLHVASEEGQGSVFELTIPAGDLTGVTRQSFDELLAARRVATRESESLQGTLPPARLLIVDDGEPNRRLARLILARAGCTVDEAVHGEEALRAAERQSYHLILMDMQMPVMDGYVATSELRRRGQQVPVIALTANVMVEDRERCMAAGCTDFVAKPIQVDRLLAVVARYLQPQFPQWVPPTNSAEPPNPAVALAASHPSELACGAENEAPQTCGGPFSLTATCELDLADDELRDIAMSFVRELHTRHAAVATLAASGQWQALAEFAHWLKGAGGTCGFPVFSEPARHLEQSAKAHQSELCERALHQIAQLARHAQQACQIPRLAPVS